MSAGPQRRGAKVVDAVLAATIEELARVGFSGLSVEEVALRAAVNKTTIYRRWPTKAELVLAALAAAGGDEDPPDTGALRGDLFEHMRKVQDRLSSRVGRAIFLALLADAEAISSVAGELRAKGDTRIRNIVKRAVERGELPRGVEIELLAELMFGALQLRILFIPDRPTTDAYLEKIIDAAIAGVSAVRTARRRPR